MVWTGDNSSGFTAVAACLYQRILAYTTGMRATNIFLWGSFLDALVQCASIFLVLGGMAQAQEAQQRGGPATVRVHGQATLSVEPDQVQFDIGVVTQASTPKAASEQNANQSGALVQQLNAAFPSASVKKVNFSVNPNFEYPREGTPKIAGYTATNTVRLLLNDISNLQAVMDIAIKSGANSVDRVAFTLRSENAVRAQALAGAANQALDGAKSLAAALNLKLGRLLTVEEGQPVIVSAPQEIRFEKLQSTNLAPISAGTIDVHADVDLTYELLSAAARVPETPRSPRKK
jgi:hypothetical protein